MAQVDGSDHRILAEAEGLHSFSWSPESEHLAYNVDPGSKMYVANVSGDEAAWYVAEGGEGSWAPCQRILLREEGDIYSIRPDGSGLAFVGEAPDLGMQCQPKGELVAVERVEHPGSLPHIELLAVDGSGSLGTLTTGRLPGPAWSPDGSRLAVYRDDGERTLVMVDVEKREEVALVSTKAKKGS